jgi:hypothetical protein
MPDRAAPHRERRRRPRSPRRLRPCARLPNASHLPNAARNPRRLVPRAARTRALWTLGPAAVRPATRPRGAAVSPLGTSWARALFIKRPLLLASTCRTSQPPVVPSAGTRQGCRGEPSFPRPPFPTIVLSTTSRTYDSSPARSLLPPSRHLAGAGLLAAAARLCRGVPLPARPDPNQAPESNLGESLVVSPPSPADPATGAAQFRRAAPPSMPGTTLHPFPSFQGDFRKPGA